MKIGSRLTDVSLLGKLARFAAVGTLAVLLTAQVTGVRMVSKAQASTEIECTTGCDVNNLLCHVICQDEFNSVNAAFNACVAQRTDDCLNNAGACAVATHDSPSCFTTLLSCLSGANAFCESPEHSGAANERLLCFKVCNLNELICDAICDFLDDVNMEGLGTDI